MRAAHELMAKAYRLPGAKVHWYGKEDGMKQGRKASEGLGSCDVDEGD